MSPESKRHLWYLRKIPVFAGLPPSVLDELAGAAELRERPRKTCLYLEGDVADRVFFLHGGRVHALHEATGPADRIRIAREFNGLSSEPPAPGTCARPTDSAIAPKYDVVIANSVAYEGVDLQVRTCTIHHLDLPWTPADLEQRNGRAVRQGNTLGTVQIYYYFADRSTDGYRFSLIDGKAGWLGELLKSQVRDTNNPAAQQQLTPEDIVLMISRDKDKTRAMLEEKRKRQAEEARGKIAREAARLLRQAAARFRDARTTPDPERAARLRDEGEQRLADLEQVNSDAWPWAPWMYAVRDLDMIVPENGGAPVYEGLRLARPRPGAPDQLDYLEFGQIVTTEEGDKIGLRAAGSPGWQLIAYAGTLNGSPIAPGELPRDGGPLWPDDDDTRTAAAIKTKIEDVFRYGRFEGLRWRGASDAWIEKWWPRFETPIAEGLAASSQREKVPVVDAEGLAIASGAEIRDATILPPTRAGWQRFLELAPASGESFTTLKEVGLGWWGRKVPQDLLSKERNLLRELIVPRLLEDVAYRNARENVDPQNARVEHDKALGRVMLALFAEDAEKHGELYRRYSDDEAWRRSLHEQSFAATYSSEGKQDSSQGRTKGTPSPNEPRITEDQWTQLQALFEQDARRGHDEDPEAVDRRVIDNLLLQRAAMGDALAMAGMGKRDRDQQAEQATQAARRITVLRAEASVLRGRGYGVSLSGAPERAFNLIGLGGRVVAVRLIAPADKVVVAPGVDADTRARVERDVEDARRIVEQIIQEENARGPKDTEETMLAVWRRARETSSVDSEEREPTGPQAPVVREASTAKRPEAPTSSVDRQYDEARSAIKRLGLPASKYAQYVSQAEKAIASGKSYAPIVERARKAAEKLTGRKSDGKAARPPSRRILDVALETFNAEPRWRLALHRTIPNGWVLVVYPEGKGPDEAVVAVDIILENVDDVRWLDDRLSPADQDTIMDRLDRALWAAFEVREEQEGAADDEKTEVPSPLEGLIDLMQRRSKALGARPEASRDLARTDGYQEIARALQELAVPSGIGAEELQKWLESHDLMTAGDLIARARVEPVPVSRLMRDLWDILLDAFEVAEVQEEGGVLRVPEDAIHAIAGHDTILERVVSGDGATLRHVRVTPGEVDEDGLVTVDDPTDRLAPGAVVHLRSASERELVELYRTIQAFYHNLAVAPKTLQDVRTLLYWTAVMLDVPRCQGEVKSRATAAFEQAKQYYNTARFRLMDGVSVDAVRRMHEALRRISAAAAEIARSCGEGQIEIAVTPGPMPVSPEDRAAILDEQVEGRP